MNAIARGLAADNAMRTLLGEGDPGLHVLLGGDDPLATEAARIGSGAARVARSAAEVRVAGGSGSSGARLGQRQPGDARERFISGRLAPE